MTEDNFLQKIFELWREWMILHDEECVIYTFLLA